MIFSNTHEENLILAFVFIMFILITLSLVFVYIDYSDRVKLFVSMIILFEGLSIFRCQIQVGCSERVIAQLC